MAIVDSQGRLFGKVSLLDVGAGAIVAMVVGGIFLLPGKTGSAVGGDAGTPVEVDVIVLGLKSAEDVKTLLKAGDNIDIIIRNEPAGSVTIDKLTVFPRDVLVPQPDGTIKALPDPRPRTKFFTSFLMTLKGNAKVVDDGVVFGNKKVKIGTTLELESSQYNFNSSVLQVRQ